MGPDCSFATKSSFSVPKSSVILSHYAKIISTRSFKTAILHLSNKEKSYYLCWKKCNFFNRVQSGPDQRGLLRKIPPFYISQITVVQTLPIKEDKIWIWTISYLICTKDLASDQFCPSSICQVVIHFTFISAVQLIKCSNFTDFQEHLCFIQIHTWTL